MVVGKRLSSRPTCVIRVTCRRLSSTLASSLEWTLYQITDLAILALKKPSLWKNSSERAPRTNGIRSVGCELGDGWWYIRLVFPPKKKDFLAWKKATVCMCVYLMGNGGKAFYGGIVYSISISNVHMGPWERGGWGVLRCKLTHLLGFISEGQRRPFL